MPEGNRRGSGLFGEAQRSTRESNQRLADDPKKSEAARKQRSKDRARRSDRVNRIVEQIKRTPSNPLIGARPAQYALAPVEVIPPVTVMPRSAAIYNIVPKSTEYPTSRYEMDESAVGGGQPWSVNPFPAGLPFVTDIVGTLVVMMGTQIVAQVASRITNTMMRGNVGFSVADPTVRIRVHTGRGPGEGSYQRTRGEGGELPDDDADPYDQPSEWWEFWKWSF